MDGPKPFGLLESGPAKVKGQDFLCVTGISQGAGHPVLVHTGDTLCRGTGEKHDHCSLVTSACSLCSAGIFERSSDWALAPFVDSPPGGDVS